METSGVESIIKEYSFVFEIFIILVIFYIVLRFVFYVYNKLFYVISFVIKILVALVIAILLYYALKYYTGIPEMKGSKKLKSISKSGLDSLKTVVFSSSGYVKTAFESEMISSFTNYLTETLNYAYVNIFEYVSESEE